MADPSKLLPCPFCGGDALILSRLSGAVFCEECGAEGPWSPSTRTDWNTRAPDPRVAALVKAADDMLAAFCIHEHSDQVAAYEATCVALAAVKESRHG